MARACPPRALHGEGQALALRYSVRFQHGEGQALALRPTEIHKVTVARGPRMPHAHPSGCPPRSQHGEGQALALRYSVRFQHGEGQALALRPTEIHKVTVARGPVPRERLGYRSAGACPPRASRLP